MILVITNNTIIYFGDILPSSFTIFLFMVFIHDIVVNEEEGLCKREGERQRGILFAMNTLALV